MSNRCAIKICNKETTKYCSGCKTVYYCGRTCQKQDWKHHKNECQERNDFKTVWDCVKDYLI